MSSTPLQPGAVGSSSSAPSPAPSPNSTMMSGSGPFKNPPPMMGNSPKKMISVPSKRPMPKPGSPSSSSSAPSPLAASSNSGSGGLGLGASSSGAFSPPKAPQRKPTPTNSGQNTPVGASSSGPSPNRGGDNINNNNNDAGAIKTATTTPPPILPSTSMLAQQQQPNANVPPAPNFSATSQQQQQHPASYTIGDSGSGSTGGVANTATTGPTSRRPAAANAAASPERLEAAFRTQGRITSLEMQLDSYDAQLIDAITANEQSRSACENLIRNSNGIGGVAKMVMACHDMAQDIQNFEAELAALNGEELNVREENVAKRAELESAIKCMETLLLDVASPMARKALLAGSSSSSSSTPSPSPASVAAYRGPDGGRRPGDARR